MIITNVLFNLNPIELLWISKINRRIYRLQLEQSFWISKCRIHFKEQYEQYMKRNSVPIIKVRYLYLLFQNGINIDIFVNFFINKCRENVEFIDFKKTYYQYIYCNRMCNKLELHIKEMVIDMGSLYRSRLVTRNGY
jgi:hypothetical protein